MRNDREGLEFHRGAYLAVSNSTSITFSNKFVRGYNIGLYAFSARYIIRYFHAIQIIKLIFKSSKTNRDLLSTQ